MLKLLAAVSSEASKQRWSCYKISAVPLLILSALLDDVYMIADLEWEILCLGGIEGVCADGKGDCGQRLPGHCGDSALLAQWIVVCCTLGEGASNASQCFKTTLRFAG